MNHMPHPDPLKQKQGQWDEELHCWMAARNISYCSQCWASKGVLSHDWLSCSVHLTNSSQDTPPHAPCKAHAPPQVTQTAPCEPTLEWRLLAITGWLPSFLIFPPSKATTGFCVGVGVAEVGVHKLRGQWEGWASLLRALGYTLGGVLWSDKALSRKYLLQGIEILPVWLPWAVSL